MNKDLYAEVIDEGVAHIKSLEPGADDYLDMVEAVNSMVDRSNEIEKIREDKKDRRNKNLLTGLGIGLPIAASFVGTVSTLRWETVGIVSSKAGKTWVDRLLKIKQ